MNDLKILIAENELPCLGLPLVIQIPELNTIELGGVTFRSDPDISVGDTVLLIPIPQTENHFGIIGEIKRINPGKGTIIFVGERRTFLEDLLIAQDKETLIIERTEYLEEAIWDEIKYRFGLIDEEGLLSPDLAMYLAADLVDEDLFFRLVGLYQLHYDQAVEIYSSRTLIEASAIFLAFLVEDTERLSVLKSLDNQVENKLKDNSRKLFLREQLNIIKEELGDEIVHESENVDLSKLPPEVREEVESCLRRLSRLSPETLEHSLLRSYVDFVLRLPFGQLSPINCDLAQVKYQLEKYHLGLAKVKDRVLEFLAVRHLNPQNRGQILALVGPPGVGKTSLARSIAAALEVPFASVALGGVRDEAEIRGHRRTYVGAMPGRIIQAVQSAASMNCLVLLDEIDKIGLDGKGDPASALLEVLDVEQNFAYRDVYLGVPFDLSKIMFIATANSVDMIPDALLDRLDVIEISSYTLLEKIAIANKFIIPRQIKDSGLRVIKPILQKKALIFIIERYTSESGVRGLEREIATLFRKIARRYVESGMQHRVITPALVRKLLGPTKNDPEQRCLEDAVGVAMGLAWTTSGGEMMPIEVSVAKGSGNLTMTGQLGAVMQESAQAAMFYVRAHAKELGINASFYQDIDIHIHIPNGATPKDGPSAGVTILIAMISALAKRKVSADVAMTGEITLRGDILVVGGLKEKILAAIRSGIKTIVVPDANVHELEEIEKELILKPDSEGNKVKIMRAKNVEEVIKIALLTKASRRKSKNVTAESES